MAPLLVPLLLLVIAVPLILALVRANELFCLRVRGDRIIIARGRIPQRLLDDIADVVQGGAAPRDSLPGDRASGERRATIRGVVEERRARVYVEGDLSPEQCQRLRNTVSTWPVARIRAAPRPR